MALPVTLKNAVDTWVNQNANTKNYGNGTRLQMKSGASVNKNALIFFSRPWPAGSTIVSAKLGLFSGTTFAGSTTITVQRTAAKWSVNRVSYGGPNGQPGVTGATASTTQTGAVAGSLWEIDVTALLQAVADGGGWYGFKVTTNNTSDNWFHSAQAVKGSLRPYLLVTWSDQPDQPDSLSPAGNRAVSLNKPTLRSSFVDLTGDVTMASIQVQIDALNDFTTGIDFDSGEVATSIPQLDLSGTAYAGLADGASTWWRDRVKDGAGLWSAWSDPVQFSRFSKGTLTITTPASATPVVYEPSPDIAWTFTGRTQKAYQVIISTPGDANNWIWDSGKVTSTATTCTVPFGTIDATSTYRVTVRIWDTIDRETTPNDPVYVEATRDFTIAYDGAVTAPAAFGMSSDTVLPVAHLTFTRAATPDTWVLMRSDDGGTTFKFVGEYVGSSLSTGGTNYALDDTTAGMYKQYVWKILAVVGGHMSASSPTVSGTVRRLAPFLMRTDQTDAVCFMNPKRSRAFNDVQELYETLGGADPVLVTQKLGRLTGHVEGTFNDNILTGVTADQMLNRFLRMRKDSGVKMVVAIANDTYTAVAFNFQYETLTDSGGITYWASFDWVEWR